MSPFLLPPNQMRDLPLSAVKSLGMTPEPWQLDVLITRYWRLLLNCCRGAGKSTVVALWAVLEAVGRPDTLVVLLSRSFKQSQRLFEVVVALHQRLGAPELDYRTRHELGFKNLSRVVCLPCNEKTARGITNVKLLVVDEAAQVPDSFYNSVLGMLAPDGRVVCLSTPFGRRGFFWRLWASGDPSWRRIEVPASQVPRLDPAFLEQQRKDMGESSFQQEYCCAFGAMEGLIYPDFAKQAIRGRELEWREAWGRGTRVGGLDFGDNFAAVWGVVDHEGVLWLTDEYYRSGGVLAIHAQFLPREAMWYADPSGKPWIRELQHANFKVRKGLSAVDMGINAVRTRLETGRLRIKPGTCRHLLAEAEIYRWDPDKPGHPLKENDHALDALRYLVARLDQGKMARWRRWFTPEDRLPPDLPPPPPEPPKQKWLSIYNEALWTPICTIYRNE